MSAARRSSGEIRGLLIRGLFQTEPDVVTAGPGLLVPLLPTPRLAFRPSVLVTSSWAATRSPTSCENIRSNLFGQTTQDGVGLDTHCDASTVGFGSRGPPSGACPNANPGPE